MTFSLKNVGNRYHQLEITPERTVKECREDSDGRCGSGDWTSRKALLLVTLCAINVHAKRDNIPIGSSPHATMGIH